MSTSVTIHRPEGPVRGSIHLPPSKSVANRALILASLAGELPCVKNIGDADDTRILHQLLRERPAEMHCGDGGTTFRFLLAWACVREGEEHLITGNKRLLERPHASLINALRELGADLSATANGFLVRGKKLNGGTITLDSPESSQFISALLLVAPCFVHGLHLQWTGLRLSEPYVQMTLRLLARFGAEVRENEQGIHVAPGVLKAAPFHVPADWSAASFWYQIAALAPDSEFCLYGLKADGLQGDQAVVTLFGEHVFSQAMDDGIELRSISPATTSTFTADLVRTPDLFQPLAFTMAALGRLAVLTGLHNLPLKETDRLKAVADALQVLGIHSVYQSGCFNIEPQGPLRETAEGAIPPQGPIRESAAGAIPPQGPIRETPDGAMPAFDPQGDHRMAMALAPLALVCGSITVLHTEVVNKSYPGFWEELRSVGFSVECSG